MIKYQNFPLKQLRDTAQIFKNVRDHAKKNKEFYRIEKDENFEIHLRGLDANSNFTFKISEPVFNDKIIKLSFSISFNPISEFKLDTNRIKDYSERIIIYLNSWLAILQSYLSISLYHSDNIEKQYENEFKDNFEDWFEIVEDDADETTYDTEIQLLISNTLVKCIDILQNEGYDGDDDAVQQANYIRENVTNLTKRQVFNALKSFYAKLKLKKNGLILLKKIYETAKEEAINIGVKYSLDSVITKLIEITS